MVAAAEEEITKGEPRKRKEGSSADGANVKI